MTISVFQAVALGVIAYVSSICTVSGLTIGWYTLTRPLVAGLVVGLVMGDVATGIIVGAAVQVVFIALVTPGGQLSSDLNFASYVGVPLGVIAVKSGASVESAVSIATAVGALGTIVYNLMMMTNSIWNARALKAAETADYKELTRCQWVYPQIVMLFYRAVLTAVCLYAGQGLATSIIAAFPADSILMRSLTVLGGMLPAVGIGILLGQVTKKDFDLVRFLLGFVLVAAMGQNMITVAVIGAFFAYSHFVYSERRGAAAASTAVELDGNGSDDEEL